MATFWGSITPEDIVENNDKLEQLIESLQRWWMLWWSGDRTTEIHRDNTWQDIVEVIEEQASYFKKNVRFPTAIERNQQWDRFYNLRQQAYNIRNEQKTEATEEHYNRLNQMADNADYGFFDSDNLFDKETLREKSNCLKECWDYFKQHKYGLSKEHKDEIFGRLTEIRDSNNRWWEEYKKFKEDRRDRAKERLQDVLEKKISSRQNTNEFLEKLYTKKSEIEDSISTAWNDNFREKQEERLENLEEKIADVENKLEQNEQSIQDLENKLSNWAD